MCTLRRSMNQRQRLRSVSSLMMLGVMLLMLLQALVVPTLAALTPLVHMTNHCYKDIYVNDSLLLDLTENLQADRVMVGHLSCAATLHAPVGARVFLHVLQLAISDHIQMPDRLHIYDMSNTGIVTKRLTPSTGLYGVLERQVLIYNTAGIIVPDFRSSGSRMRIDYQGKPTIIYRGFRVLVTVFYTPDDKGRCRAGTVRCPYADTCVPWSVRCDHQPNCGLNDNSDEKTCTREDVVTDVLDEYATRTAVIAAVTGIFVFLGVAAIVFVVIVKYTRKRYGRGADQSARYTSRGGGASRAKDESDLLRLYAPPSYEDVMTPRDQEVTSRGRYGTRHCGPPPAYSAVPAALVHQEEAALSSEDETSHPHPHNKRSPPPSSLLLHHSPPCQPPPPAFPHSKHHHHHHRTPRERRPRDREEKEEEKEKEEEDEDEEYNIRMHGTWPSDTDEEEEVRARRRKKGGKCKGKGAKTKAKPENITTTPNTKPSRREEEEEEEVGGNWGNVPSEGSGGAGTGSGGEVVSETESHLAVAGVVESPGTGINDNIGGGNKRNSRTESNLLDSSSASSSNLCSSPAKQPVSSTEEEEEGDCLKSSGMNYNDRSRSESQSSIHAISSSPSVIPQTTEAVV